MKNQTKRILSRLCATVLGVFTIASTPLGAAEPVEAASNGYELVDEMQDASILHCWNWSYQTIEENLELIAQCDILLCRPLRQHSQKTIPMKV